MNTDSKNIRKANASMEQKQLLLEFIKKHPKLTSGKFSNEFTQKDSQQLWQNLTNILNSCGDGANKDWKSWRKTWQDIRSRTKIKNCGVKKHQRGTGGGPALENPITNYEKEVLETINLVSMQGHTNVSESSTEFLLDSNMLLMDTEEESESKINSPNIKNIRRSFCIQTTSEVTENEHNFVDDRDSIITSEPSSSRKLSASNSQIKKDTNVGFKKKFFPRAARKKLVYASEASENYRISLEKKNNLKSEYYERKLIILEREAAAKERSAVANERSAAASERLADAMKDIANGIKEFLESIC